MLNRPYRVPRAQISPGVLGSKPEHRPERLTVEVSGVLGKWYGFPLAGTVESVGHPSGFWRALMSTSLDVWWRVRSRECGLGKCIWVSGGKSSVSRGLWRRVKLHEALVRLGGGCDRTLRQKDKSWWHVRVCMERRVWRTRCVRWESDMKMSQRWRVRVHGAQDLWRKGDLVWEPYLFKKTKFVARCLTVYISRDQTHVT